MGGEKRFIPILSGRLTELIPAFLLRTLIIIFYGSMIGVLIYGISEYMHYSLYHPLYSNPLDYEQYVKYAKGQADMMVKGTLVTISIIFFTYWICIYLLARLFKWLFTGK